MCSRSILLLTTALVASLGLRAQVAQTRGESDPGGASIEFETPVFDFGTVKQGEVVLHDFKFHNRGDAPLLIQNVRPGCGCTTAGEWTKNVAPGESGVIPIKVDTARFKGPISKSVTVTSNDSRKANIYLQMKGEIWTPVTVSPQVAAFPAIKALDEIKTTTINITNQLDQPLEIRNLTTEGGAFASKLLTVEKGKIYQIEVTTVPPLVYGSNRGTVRFETNIPNAKDFSVAASAYVMAPVQAVPNRLLMPAGVLKQPLKKYLTVITYEDKPLLISDIKVPLKDVKVESQSINENKHYRITLEFPAGLDADALKDVHLSFKTNHEEFGSFEVPIGTYQSLRN